MICGIYANFPCLWNNLRHSKKFHLSIRCFTAAIGNKGRAAKRPWAVIDLMLPIEEIGRANMAFERIGYVPQKESESLRKEEQTPKKESRSRESSKDTRSKTNTRDRAGTMKTNEKPSVEEKLKGYQAQKQQAVQKQPVRSKSKTKGKMR